MRILGIAAVAMVLVGCVGMQSVDDPAGGFFAQGPEARFQEGRRHFEAGRHGLALVAFRTALNTQPNHMRALNGAAAAYDVMGRYDLADRYYQQALALDPDSPQTLNNIAYSHMLRGNFAVAGTYLDWARQHAGSASRRVEATIDGNLARLRGHPGAALADKAVEDAPLPLVRVAENQVSQGWIERHSESVLYLVLAPEPELNERLRALEIAPQYASYMPDWSGRALKPSEVLVGSAELAAVATRSGREREETATGDTVASTERPTPVALGARDLPLLKLNLGPVATDAGSPPEFPASHINDGLAEAVVEDPAVAEVLPPLIIEFPPSIPAELSLSRLSFPPGMLSGSTAEPHLSSANVAATTETIDHRSIPIGTGRMAVGRPQQQV